MPNVTKSAGALKDSTHWLVRLLAWFTLTGTIHSTVCFFNFHWSWYRERGRCITIILYDRRTVNYRMRERIFSPTFFMVDCFIPRLGRDDCFPAKPRACAHTSLFSLKGVSPPNGLVCIFGPTLIRSSRCTDAVANWYVRSTASLAAARSTRQLHSSKIPRIPNGLDWRRRLEFGSYPIRSVSRAPLPLQHIQRMPQPKI